MILIVGEYLKIEKANEFTIGGLALDVSIEIAKHGVSVSFESLISKDDIGVRVLDKLIDFDILFDPALCNSDFLSGVYSINGCSLTSNDYCSTKLNKEQFLSSLSNHDDVKLIHYGSFSFYSSLEKCIIDTFDDLPLRPIFYFNPSFTDKEIINIDKFEEKSKVALSYCNIAQVNESFLQTMYPEIDNKLDYLMNQFPNVNVLYVCKNKIIYESSLSSGYDISISKTIDPNEQEDIKNINSIVAGSFLSYLHENELFGNELSDPVYIQTHDGIESALNHIAMSLN